jgi:hypothetical protein
MLDVDICERFVFVGIKGNPPYLHEELHGAIKVDESMWMFDDGVVEISLQKQKKAEAWAAVFKGHGQLNPLVEQQVGGVSSLLCVVWGVRELGLACSSFARRFVQLNGVWSARLLLVCQARSLSLAWWRLPAVAFAAEQEAAARAVCGGEPWFVAVVEFAPPDRRRTVAWKACSPPHQLTAQRNDATGATRFVPRACRVCFPPRVAVRCMKARACVCLFVCSQASTSPTLSSPAAPRIRESSWVECDIPADADGRVGHHRHTCATISYCFTTIPDLNTRVRHTVGTNPGNEDGATSRTHPLRSLLLPGTDAAAARRTRGGACWETDRRTRRRAARV